MTPDVRRDAEARTVGYEAEAVVAELTDVLDAQTAEIARLRREVETLRAERARLEADLGLAKEVATRVSASDARTVEQPSPLRARLERAGRLTA